LCSDVGWNQGRLGRLDRYDPRLQRYCGIAWKLAERSVQPRR
jgi:hypothetical protein